MTTLTAPVAATEHPLNPTDVYVDGEKLYGVRAWAYRVWVDGSLYDEFTSRTPISGRDMMDVAAMYRDGLTIPATARTAA